MDEIRKIDEEINLIKYYPNYEIALEWYQDPELCKQVDNRDSVYDLSLLMRMYQYLNENGDLFYIEYKNELCGDVCLKPDGEVCIVVAKPYQNKHIGRRVIEYVKFMAKEKGLAELHAEIYSFNTQSRKMFESVGFQQIAEEQYVLHIK
jgi:N-acetylglutamate synthase-like GNAT family acetyltransferase